MCAHFATVTDAQSGRHYRAADGNLVQDRGQRIVMGRVGAKGPLRSAKFRVAKVSRALMCVADMVDNEQRVIFDRTNGVDSSRMIDKATGIETPIVRRNRVYEFDLHVAKSAPFERHCRRR